MSYRCSPCGRAVGHGVTRRVYVVRRPNGEIDREIPVCGTCAEKLAEGVPLDQILPESALSYRTARPIPLPPPPIVLAPVIPVRLSGRRGSRPTK